MNKKTPDKKTKKAATKPSRSDKVEYSKEISKKSKTHKTNGTGPKRKED